MSDKIINFESDQLKVDFTRWTYGDFTHCTLALARGQFMEANPYMAKVIPSLTEDDLSDLPLTVSMPMRKTFMSKVDDALKALDLTACDVDLSLWNDRTMQEFNKAKADADVEKIERMMRQVCELEGVTEAPLTFVQGATMARSIQERYTKLLRGE